MAVILSRLDAAQLRPVLGRAGGGFLAEAGGGWTLLLPAAGAQASEQDRDGAAYALIAAVRDLDRSAPTLLLWSADPDSGYLLQRGPVVDSHVWGDPHPAATRGNPAAVARALRSREVEISVRALLRRPGPAGECVRAFAGLLGADSAVIGQALAGRPLAAAVTVPGPASCQCSGHAHESVRAAERSRWAGWLVPASWLRRGLVALAALFALVVVAGALGLGSGQGPGAGDLVGVVVFSLLAVTCLAGSFGLRRSLE